MATTKEYIDYVCEQIKEFNPIAKKMFGEYMVYINMKPVLLVCDDTVFVKQLDEIKDLMDKADKGFPYDGAKEHYILDIDNKEHTYEIIEILEKIIKIPKKRSKKS